MKQVAPGVRVNVALARPIDIPLRVAIFPSPVAAAGAHSIRHSARPPR